MTCPRRPTARAASFPAQGCVRAASTAAAATAKSSRPPSAGARSSIPARSAPSRPAGTRTIPIDYSHLNIQGYALGGEGLPEGVEANSDTCTFPDVRVETEYGWDLKVKMLAPVFTGASGLHRDRPQELGAFRHRRGHQRCHLRVWRERGRHRPGARTRRQGQDQATPPTSTAASRSTSATTAAMANCSCR